ncbi:hypothetical protein GX51_00481 [Blastomyces parvus]|uniref:Uncharacterized protein n=1 Tax=Blastomyces parvus TaxID=2060905 RepID=A0A2B7XDQ8_9EURO|nr:hypothetical protein GX51_00481 [Blastomyces parvus]
MSRFRRIQLGPTPSDIIKNAIFSVLNSYPDDVKGHVEYAVLHDAAVGSLADVDRRKEEFGDLVDWYRVGVVRWRDRSQSRIAIVNWTANTDPRDTFDLWSWMYDLAPVGKGKPWEEEMLRKIIMGSTWLNQNLENHIAKLYGNGTPDKAKNEKIIRTSADSPAPHVGHPARLRYDWNKKGRKNKYEQMKCRMNNSKIGAGKLRLFFSRKKAKVD